jgi:hypothetical protein
LVVNAKQEVGDHDPSAASATLRRIGAYLDITVSLLDESHPHR